MLRGDIKLKSPKVLKSPRSKKKIDVSPTKQCHILVTSDKKSNMVKNLIHSFEQNSVNCFKLSKNEAGNDDKSLDNIKEGLVRNASEKLMSKKEVETPIKTPRRKGTKRLNNSKITSGQSGQKKIDEWVRK